MTDLYSLLETDTNRTLNSKQDTQKIDIIFDLDANTHTVLDNKCDKNIICVCGSCDLLLRKNGKEETVKLNNHKITVHLNKDIQAELTNYTSDARVFVQYLEDINE